MFQEFFFDNVTHEELDTKVVIITACHAGGGIKGKEIVIGIENKQKEKKNEH